MNLLDLCSQAGLQPKRVSIGEYGEEYHSHCPSCGGNDRFFIQPNRLLKNELHGFWKCRKCEKSGDPIAFLTEFLGYTESDAFKTLGLNMNDNTKIIPAQRAKSLATKPENDNRSYSDEDVLRCRKLVSKNGSNTYFDKKGSKPPYIAMFGKNPNGFYGTMIPLIDINGEFQGFTSISSSGGKYQYKLRNCGTTFSLLGELKDNRPVIIGEGIATVQIVWEVYNEEIPGVIAGSIVTLRKVIEEIRGKYPNTPLFIIADLKNGEPEKKVLEIAAMYTDITILKPNFNGIEKRYNGPKEKLTDADDLRSKCKLPMEETRKRIIKHELGAPIESVKTTDDSESEFAYLLKNNSEKKLIEELKNISPGITTGYKIGEIDLAFPGGAISIIAAPTSHGKTTGINNFSLGALEEKPEKNVYIFSYEESAASILISLTNTWISKKMLKLSENTPPFSKNNKRSIESYFRENTDQYIARNKYEFTNYKESFFNEIIDTGRLKVIYTDMKVGKLVEAIKFINANDPHVGIICIDYTQLLQTEKPRSSRQEELKQICLQLKDCAVDTGLPIVLAAQFNREVVSEAHISSVKIGEAGDIERIASFVIGIFNRNFDKMSKDGNTGKDGNTIEKESAIYLEVLKGRGVGAGHSCIMDFDGNKGLILNRAAKDSENQNDKQPTLRDKMMQTR